MMGPFMFFPFQTWLCLAFLCNLRGLGLVWVVATQIFFGIFIPKIGEDFHPFWRFAYFSNGLVKNHQLVVLVVANGVDPCKNGHIYTPQNERRVTGPKMMGLGRPVTGPFKHGNFWYLFVRFLGCIQFVWREAYCITFIIHWIEKVFRQGPNVWIFSDVVTVSWLNDFCLISRLQMLDIDLVG